MVVVMKIHIHIFIDVFSYDCYPKPAPKTFPVCTIRSTPSAPVHCIVWAKSHLLGKLFTGPSDEESSNEAIPESEITEQNGKMKI